MRPIDAPSYRNNPHLNAWLDTARADFTALAEQTGGRWDFSPGSLPRLERLVLDRYATWEEQYDDRRGPFLRAVAWYLGEVLVRHHDAVWVWPPDTPCPSRERSCPSLTYPYDRLTGPETEAVAASEEEGESLLPTVDPHQIVGALYRAENSHLGVALEHFEGWRDELRPWLASDT
ncbi:hypothetical protein [Streptomyces sp. NPDC004546]|jgi:hypothetical protein|uniref:hypothetical protein n=1 Tax=unclassified Streptomyces TaxID=2593676 RepID=UPI0033BC11F9